MVGNSNNGTANPPSVTSSTGVEIATPGQDPGTIPTQVGVFSINQVIDPTTGAPFTQVDKPGKDNNFRGLTLFQNNLYISKGSGSNGIDTVYMVGNPHELPILASAPITPIVPLPGFPVASAKTAGVNNIYPFGLWFANADTLYVADEGDGVMADAAVSQFAGLQKWVRVNGVWQLAYVMQNGLNLGQPYSVPGRAAALNPATDGLRNITGRVNGDGTVTIWAITSTISDQTMTGDQGADPNKLVTITDLLDNLEPAIAAYEPFTVLESAANGEVLRGVSFTPGTVSHHGRR
jgi:hypothetical protein